MKLAPEIWLKKMENQRNADEIFIMTNGEGFTPRENAKRELLWL